MVLARSSRFCPLKPKVVSVEFQLLVLMRASWPSAVHDVPLPSAVEPTMVTVSLPVVPPRIHVLSPAERLSKRKGLSACSHELRDQPKTKDTSADTSMVQYGR